MPTDDHEHKYLSELITHDRGFVLNLPEVLLNRTKSNGHVCTLIKAIYHSLTDVFDERKDLWSFIWWLYVCMYVCIRGKLRSFWNQYLTSYLKVLGLVEVVKSPY